MMNNVVGEIDLSDERRRPTILAAGFMPIVMILLAIVPRIIPSVPVMAVAGAYGAAFLGMLVFTLYDYFHSATDDMSYALLVPLALTVFMNLFLSGIAHDIPHGVASVILSSNIMYCFVVAAAVAVSEFFHGKREWLITRISILLAILITYAIVLYVVFPASLTSFASTLRNLITPFCFLLLGSTLAKRVDFGVMCDLVLLYGLVVLAFGVIERFLWPNFWVEMNIQDLWGLKGITVYDYRLPNNFYSSERFGGLQTRRMASLIADPVNLGAFLFAVFGVAWYRKRWVVVALSIVGCILTISKGALLGFLIWIFIYFLVLSDSVWVKRGALLFVIVAALGFLGFTAVNSTGSAVAHMKGALGGLASMVENPFGYGCGNVGVLAGLANKDVMRGVEESGFGVIAGEVGVVGVLTYLVMFLLSVKASLQLTDKRLKVMAVTLLLAIFANILFNEVALSPNSCGIYFSMLGLMFCMGDVMPSSRPAGAHFATDGR